MSHFIEVTTFTLTQVPGEVMHTDTVTPVKIRKVHLINVDKIERVTPSGRGAFGIYGSTLIIFSYKEGTLCVEETYEQIKMMIKYPEA